MKKIFLLLSCVALVIISCKSSHKASKTTASVEKILTLQPGPDAGQDCTVPYRETDGGIVAAANYNGLPNLIAARASWHYSGAGEGSERGYLKFTGLSSLPKNAVIKSAKLSLYGVDSSAEIRQGNSSYPGTNYTQGTNKGWLKRVTGDWDQTTITWNNKPATTEHNKVEVPESTSQWNFDVVDLDVTALVKDMVTDNQNYGFCFQMQREEVYRFTVFGTCEVKDPSRRPKLVVTYEAKGDN